MSATQEKKYENLKFEQAMEIAGYGKFSMYIIFLSGLTICSAFLSSLDVSFLMPAAECDLHLTSEDKGLLSSAYFIGVIAASHLSGFLADTLGRRYVLIRGLTLNIFSYIFGSLSPNFWGFFASKVFSGVVTCPCMIATIPFLGEYIPAKKRSQAILITTSLSTLGLLYSSLAAWITLEQTWEVDLGFVIFKPWRLFTLICSLPSMFCAILFCLTPESPKFLLTRGKKGDTMKILQRVHSVNSGKSLQSYPVDSVSMDADETVPPSIKTKGVMGVLKNISDQTLPLFHPQYLKNLVCCVILFFASFCCVNSILLWLPEVTNRVAAYKETHEGRFYLCDMLTKIDDRPYTNSSTATPAVCKPTVNTAVFLPNLIIAVVQPVVMLLASFIVPLLDRRLTMTFLMLFCSSMAFLVTLVPNAVAIVIMFASIPIFIGIAYNVLSSILIELFPTYIRAMAVSFTMICGRLGSITGSQLFSLLIDSKCSHLFNIIAAFMLCCAMVPYCLKLKDTKSQQPSGLDLQQVPAPDKKISPEYDFC